MNRGPAMLAWLISAAAFCLLAFGLRLPVWLAITVTVGAALGVQALLAARPAPGETAEPLDDVRRRTAEALLQEGRTALERLRRATAGVRDQAMRRDLKALCETADGVLGDVRDDLSKAMPVRRLMTFYLPNAASVAEGWRALEAQVQPAPERLAQTRDTVAALNDVFDRFADALAQPRLESLDLDLKLLNDALKSDLDDRR